MDAFMYCSAFIQRLYNLPHVKPELPTFWPDHLAQGYFDMWTRGARDWTTNSVISGRITLQGSRAVGMDYWCGEHIFKETRPDQTWHRDYIGERGKMIQDSYVEDDQIPTLQWLKGSDISESNTEVSGRPPHTLQSLNDIPTYKEWWICFSCCDLIKPIWKTYWGGDHGKMTPNKRSK